MNISPPPYRDKDLTSQSWQKWFASITDAFKSIGTAAVTAVSSWTSVDKTGSNLTDIETRNHDDLQNLNTPTHVHLTNGQYSGLVGRTDTDLHYHASDRALANATGTLATTNGGTGLITVGTNGQILTSNGTILGWENPPALAILNIVSTPTTIADDTSYPVISYLTVTSDLTVNGNLMVIG